MCIDLNKTFVHSKKTWNQTKAALWIVIDYMGGALAANNMCFWNRELCYWSQICKEYCKVIWHGRTSRNYKLKVVVVLKVRNHNHLWIMNKSAFLPIVTTTKGHVGGGDLWKLFLLAFCSEVSAFVKQRGLLQAWSGPEGSRKLRFPDFMTTAQDGGKVVSLMHRPPLPPGNAPGTHFC